MRWIPLFNRSYEEIIVSIKDRLNLYAPEITDLSNSNPFIYLTNVWAALIEQLHYYIDNMAREAHITTVQLFANAVKLAEAVDYRVKPCVAATSDIEIYSDTPFNSDYVIPASTVVSTTDGITFQTTKDVVIKQSHNFVLAPVQEFKLLQITLDVTVLMNDPSFSNLIEIDPDYADGTGRLTINNEVWEMVETFAFSKSTDKHFLVKVKHNRKVYIEVNNNYFLSSLNSALFTYNTCSKEFGNVPRLAINTINLNSPQQLYVKNEFEATGGYGVESIERIKSNVPKSLKANNRAVTKEDFIDLAEQVKGVQKAGVLFDCGHNVQLFIVPNGGGLASTTVRQEVQSYLDYRKVLTLGLEVYSAGLVDINIELNVNVNGGFHAVTVAQSVKNSLLKLLSADKQEIGGKLYLSDVYAAVENTRGVVNSDIIRLVPTPYARPMGHTTELIWNRTLNTSSIVSRKWRIQATGGNAFNLFREGEFLGQFLYGVPFNNTEITLTVQQGGYLANQSWEFVSYPYSGNISLKEPSLFGLNINNIQVNTFGGL